jgi:hypothetical protein
MERARYHPPPRFLTAVLDLEHGLGLYPQPVAFPLSSKAARDAFNRMCGLKRAAFWRAQNFPNLVLARAAKAEKRRLRLLEEWKRQELRRTPFALLDDPPPELRPRPRRR